MKFIYAFFQVLFPFYTLLAQDNKSINCTPATKLNSNKHFIYNGYSVLEKIKVQDNLIIQKVIKDSAKDSLYVYNIYNDSLVSKLELSKNGTIIGPASIAYFHKNSIYIDSFNKTDTLYNPLFCQYYFNGFVQANAIFSTTNITDGRQLFYKANHQDSLLIVKNEMGTVINKIWYGQDRDSLQLKWNNKGHIIYEKTINSKKVWNDNGVLIQHTFDTLIQSKIVQQQNTYYNSSVLQSTTYTRFGTPCLTWKYYNEKGKLIRSIVKQSLAQTPSAEVLGVLDNKNINYSIVEQQENYQPIFNANLNLILNKFLCQSEVELKGEYRLYAFVDKAGTAKYIGIVGFNDEKINDKLATYFNQLPKMVPPKINGHNYAQKIVIHLGINHQ